MMTNHAPSVAWLGDDPWPVCLECGGRVYLADVWRHFPDRVAVETLKELAQ